uniref:Transcription activation suppressor n=1 Tax=Naja naja TaxID=35670 RepID=A0A8C7E6H7_NAJNA
KAKCKKTTACKPASFIKVEDCAYVFLGRIETEDSDLFPIFYFLVALFQPITNESREFEDIVSILHSSYLDILSKDRFTYKKASLVHSELLEKDFIEKRKELKQDGRSEKELAEAYAFLKVDRLLVQNICENGLLVGHSKIAVLGNPSMGVYLSKYADLLQANPLEANATGDIIIFKIIKGKMKTIYDKYDNQTVNVMDSAVKNALDPTPKHECHVSKTANKITSSRNYRAYERTQYYFYEYQFHEIRQRPRHVCPYAVVSFLYKDEKMQKYLPQVRNIRRINHYTLWKGQLLNKGKLVCHAALISEKRPTLPCKLPEKLDVEMVMSFEKLAQKFSSRVLAKETYSGEREVFKNGMYCSLFEVVEKTRSGSNLEGLLQKLEADNLVILKPLVDGGHLLLLSPYQMASPYDNRTGRPRVLQALFLFRKPRNLVTSGNFFMDETHEVVPELPRFIQSLHYAYVHSRKDSKSDLNILMERYINDYFKRYSKYKEFVLYQYKGNLDEKTFLYPGPKNKSHLETCLQSYIFGSETYQIPISKVKKIMDSNRKPQQFSPVSDYEPLEDESDFTRRKAGKRNGSKYQNVAAKRKSAHSGDHDRGNIEDLINLIHYKKKTVDRESDSEGNRNESRRKRKCESKRESPQKQLKMSNTLENYEESLLSMIADLGGRDTDLRQQNVADPSITDLSGVLKLLSEMLTNTDFQAAKLIKQASLENYSKQTVECNPIPPKIKEEPELPNTTHENITHEKFKDPQSPITQEKSLTCLPNSLDASTIETDPDHILPLKVRMFLISSFDGCVSPCPSTPLEQNYHRQCPNSNNSEATEIHWKLIPITGGVGRVPEDQLRKLGDNQTGLKSPDEMFAYSVPKDVCEHDPRVINRQRSSDYEFEYGAFSDIPKEIEDKIHTGQEVKSEEQCDHETNNYVSDKHSVSGIIETAILEEYNIFTNKIQEILQQKNIVYVSGISKPVISAQERIMRLSEFICLQASDIAVHKYVERLSEKLNSVASSCSYSVQNASCTGSAAPADNSVTSTGLNLPLEDPVSSSNDFEEHLSEPPCSTVEGDASINEQNQSVLLDIEKEEEKEHKPVNATIEGKLTAEPKGSPVDCLPKSEKISKPVVKSDTTKQPALAGFISQLRPEVFDSIFKIIEDVRKNTLKFYIHEEQESLLCKEIKEYLTKLGNTECHPEQFLRRRGELDKLLVIIQNEDIAHLIHKIPCLVSLKRLPCVSFAGVESLDDVKNRTYNDLFVSGGFIVSDESVLNPESVNKLNEFLKFLGELSTPDEKWQWKIHCKIQKKLKELVRTNKNAMNLLALLSAYQKKHMVEILAYHSCDSQTRSTPELECLIKLQYQNIQQRHVVFLTEKNVSTFASYADNGIVVTTVSSFMHNFKSLVGCHNSVTEESLPSPTDNEKQTDAVLTLNPLELEVGVTQQ